MDENPKTLEETPSSRLTMVRQACLQCSGAFGWEPVDGPRKLWCVLGKADICGVAAYGAQAAAGEATGETPDLDTLAKKARETKTKDSPDAPEVFGEATASQAILEVGIHSTENLDKTPLSPAQPLPGTTLGAKPPSTNPVEENK